MVDRGLATVAGVARWRGGGPPPSGGEARYPRTGATKRCSRVALLGGAWTKPTLVATNWHTLIVILDVVDWRGARWIVLADASYWWGVPTATAILACDKAGYTNVGDNGQKVIVATSLSQNSSMWSARWSAPSAGAGIVVVITADATAA